MDALRTLDAYAEVVGLRRLRLDQHGCARLAFGPRLVVDIEVEPAVDCIHLYSVLGPVPAGQSKAFYRALLEANFFGQGTRGASLCVDAAHDEVLIYRRIDVSGADGVRFAALMDDFVSAAEEWHCAYVDARAPVVSPPAVHR